MACRGTARWSEPDGFARGPVEGLVRGRARRRVGRPRTVRCGASSAGEEPPWRLVVPGEEYASTGNPLLDLEILAEREAWGAIVEALGTPPVVRALALDAQGLLWVATGGGGVIRREAGRTWRVVASLPGGGGAAHENLPALPGKVSGARRGVGRSRLGLRRERCLPVRPERGVATVLASPRGDGPPRAWPRRWRRGRGRGSGRRAAPELPPHAGALRGGPGGARPRRTGTGRAWGGRVGALWLGSADGRVARTAGRDAMAQELALPCRDAAPVAETVAVVKGAGRVLWTSDGRRIAKLDLNRGSWEAQALPGPLTGATVGRMALGTSGKPVRHHEPRGGRAQRGACEMDGLPDLRESGGPGLGAAGRGAGLSSMECGVRRAGVLRRPPTGRGGGRERDVGSARVARERRRSRVGRDARGAAVDLREGQPFGGHLAGGGPPGARGGPGGWRGRVPLGRRPRAGLAPPLVRRGGDAAADCRPGGPTRRSRRPSRFARAPSRSSAVRAGCFACTPSRAMSFERPPVARRGETLEVHDLALDGGRGRLARDERAAGWCCCPTCAGRLRRSRRARARRAGARAGGRADGPWRSGAYKSKISTPAKAAVSSASRSSFASASSSLSTRAFNSGCLGTKREQQSSCGWMEIS